MWEAQAEMTSGRGVSSCDLTVMAAPALHACMLWTIGGSAFRVRCVQQEEPAVALLKKKCVRCVRWKRLECDGCTCMHALDSEGTLAGFVIVLGLKAD